MSSKMKLLSILLLSALIFSVIGLSNSNLHAETISEGTVTSHSLTVRSGPSANYKAIDYLKNGNKVTILKDGTFAYVQYGNKKGYVHSGYLKITKKENNPVVNNGSSTVGTVNTSSLTVRTGPSAEYPATDYLKKGNKVTILKNHGTFSYVQYGNKKGYVHNGYLKISTANTSVGNTKPSTPNTNTNETVYTVKSGDTLWKISQMHKTTVAKIQSLNGLASTNIKVGQKLKVNGTTNGNTTPSTPNTTQGNLKGKKIVIDPGHGGKFAGAQGFVKEEVVNLDIALKLRDKLQAQGATVIMTRTSNVALANDRATDLLVRSNIAKNNKADMFISIHANSGGSAATGTEVFWNKSGRGDQTLAANIVKEISKQTGLKNRGAKLGDLSVLRNNGATIPSVLVETGFVSNKNDASILGSSAGQNNIANAISNGVLQYYDK